MQLKLFADPWGYSTTATIEVNPRSIVSVCETTRCRTGRVKQVALIRLDNGRSYTVMDEDRTLYEMVQDWATRVAQGPPKRKPKLVEDGTLNKMRPSKEPPKVERYSEETVDENGWSCRFRETGDGGEVLQYFWEYLNEDGTVNQAKSGWFDYDPNDSAE
jgi:hypothetical protein